MVVMLLILTGSERGYNLPFSAVAYSDCFVMRYAAIVSE